MVCADWGSKYRASSVAICGSGGKEGEERVELGRRGLGRDGAQDGTPDSDDEESSVGAVAMEPCWMRCKKCHGTGTRTAPIER